MDLSSSACCLDLGFSFSQSPCLANNVAKLSAKYLAKHPVFFVGDFFYPIEDCGDALTLYRLL